jgi:HD-like signal output (HDOD) protein
MILRSVGATHQFLAKPCDAETLKHTITRACMLRELLANEHLKQLVAGLRTLPSLPTLYLEVIEVAQAPDGSLEHIGKIVERDVGMSAKILQLVNSAFFGLARHISSPVQAVSLLGLDTVKALILSAQIFSDCGQTMVPGFSLEGLWEHSMAVGACAKHISRMENCERKMLDEALMAGLLHDVGRLVLAVNLPAEYGEVLALMHARHMHDWQAEQSLLGATHAEIGAYLLGLWGLPDAIVETLAFHHRPLDCPHRAFSPLTAVTVANALVHEAEMADATGLTSWLDLDYVTTLGLSEHLPAWREAYRTTLQGAPQE